MTPSRIAIHKINLAARPPGDPASEMPGMDQLWDMPPHPTEFPSPMRRSYSPWSELDDGHAEVHPPRSAPARRDTVRSLRSLHPEHDQLESFRPPPVGDETQPLLGGPPRDGWRGAAWNRVSSKVPALQWLPEYLGLLPLQWLRDPGDPPPGDAALEGAPWRRMLPGDLIAGLTAGVMAVPQTMAYATLASLPPIYGLYSCLVPVVAYALLGTSRELSMGPVAINSLLLTSSLYPAVRDLPRGKRLAAYLPLVASATLLTGLFSIAMGLLGLGVAVNFVSPAVILGFSLGSEVLIAASQLEPLLGFSTGHGEQYLVPQLRRTLAHIGETKPAVVAVSLTSILLLSTLGRSRYTRWIPRPLFVTVAATVYSFFSRDNPGLSIPRIGPVPGGFPPITVPPFDLPTLRTCALPAFLLAVLGFMQSVAVALKFAERKGRALRPNQELFALGAAHALSSFAGSFDATGSYSRTSVNAEAGASTQVSGLMKAATVAAALWCLTPLFEYVPDAALAAIVVHAVAGMLDPEGFASLWRAKRGDFWVAVCTAGVTIFTDTTLGLACGLATSLVLIVARSSRPHTAVLGLVRPPDTFRSVLRYPEAAQFPGVLIFRFDGPLYFVSVGHFRARLAAELSRRDVRALVLDMSAITDADAAGVQALVQVNAAVRAERGIRVLFAGTRGPVRDVLWRATGGKLFGEVLPSRAPPAADEAHGNGEAADDADSQGTVEGADQQPEELRSEQFFLSLGAAAEFAARLAERKKALAERARTNSTRTSTR